jgi:UDP-glucose 4-epimerase
MSKMLITGGNGYVGRELTRLLMPDHDIVVIDNMSSGDLRFTAHEIQRFDLRRVDIRDKDEVRAIVQGFQPDALIHLAAIHYIPDCQANPPLAVETNVVGTVNLLNSCPPHTRFVHASSGAVYEKSGTALNESNSPLAPNDVYGATKLQTEHYVRYFSEWKGFASVIVRLFNVVGPGETNRHVLPEIVAQLKAGRRKLQLGDISPRRDFIHVYDAASGFAALATQGQVLPGVVQVVNLASGKAHAVQDLIGMLAEVIGEEIPVETDPSRFRRVDNPLLLADITRIGELYGWEPEHSIRDAIADVWANPDLPESLIREYSQ